MITSHEYIFRIRSFSSSCHSQLSSQNLEYSTTFENSLPVGETADGGNLTKLKYQGCSLDDQDDWNQFRNGSILCIAFNF